METKMKRIAFDLERAKKGDVFRCFDDDDDTHYISDYEGIVFLWYNQDNKKIISSAKIDLDWHHLIPDEPKPERWAVVHKCYIYDGFEKANENCHRCNTLLKDTFPLYTVVKLAEE